MMLLTAAVLMSYVDTRQLRFSMHYTLVEAFSVDNQAACWHHAHISFQYLYGVWQLDRQQIV